MQLTQKEKELLKDLKGQEKLCVEKYSQHAAAANDEQLSQLLNYLGGVPTLVNRIFLKHFGGGFVVRGFFRVVFKVAHKLRRVLPRPENSVARGYNYFFVITHFVSPFVFYYYARYAAEKYRRRVYKI